jgi:hypothetical protein
VIQFFSRKIDKVKGDIFGNILLLFGNTASHDKLRKLQLCSSWIFLGENI